MGLVGPGCPANLGPGWFRCAVGVVDVMVGPVDVSRCACEESDDEAA